MGTQGGCGNPGDIILNSPAPAFALWATADEPPRGPLRTPPLGFAGRMSPRGVDKTRRLARIINKHRPLRGGRLPVGVLGMSILPESSENKRGMPIFLDDQVRGVVDSLEADNNNPNWFPANGAALKLWHCLESLRDVDLMLEEALRQKNATKKKRKLKQFSVHLFSLASALVQLCDQIVGDKSNHGSLAPNTTKEVAQLKKQFLALVPIDWKSDLTRLRHELGAHIDSKIWPWQAQELLKRSTVSTFGRWLHICLHVLLDLTKLNIYAWNCHSKNKEIFRLMTNEPFLATFELESGRPKALVALHIAKRSPRESIIEVAGLVINNSQWMFDPGERRIGGLKVDKKEDHWNTFVRGHALWKEL